MIVEKEFNFAQTLKEIRESRGLSQKELGEKVGIDPNRISNWELGYSLPQMAAFRAVCIALNCPPGDLLNLSPSPLTPQEYRLIKGYRMLDEAGQRTVDAVLDSQVRLRSLEDG